MNTPRWLIANCLACEGRRFVGDGTDELACQYCNPWCTFCLAEVPSPFRFLRPQIGSLVAGVFHPRFGLGLFRGYVCDFHKGCLRSYSFIDPWMVDHTRFQIATAYIAVQWSNAFVELYAIGEAANWRDLEPE